jgi:hypothetical protein
MSRRFFSAGLLLTSALVGPAALAQPNYPATVDVFGGVDGDGPGGGLELMAPFVEGEGSLLFGLARGTMWDETGAGGLGLGYRSQLLPGSRHRLGRVLWSIGSRLGEDSTVLARMTGLQLMLDGTTDLGDEAERERVDKRMTEARALLTAANHAAIERWPLLSLWEEVAEARAPFAIARDAVRPGCWLARSGRTWAMENARASALAPFCLPPGLRASRPSRGAPARSPTPPRGRSARMNGDGPAGFRGWGSWVVPCSR